MNDPTKMTTKKNMQSYVNLMYAIQLIQDYFEKPMSESNREDLSVKLGQLGEIGQFFDNAGIISGRKDTSTLTGFRFPLGKANYAAIGAVFEYSKHVAIEMQYSALQDPVLGIQLAKINANLAQKKYVEAKTAAGDYNNIKQAYDARKDKQPNAITYLADANSALQAMQNSVSAIIDPTYFAAFLDAGIQRCGKNDKDLTRFFQNGVPVESKADLKPLMINYFTRSNISYDDTALDTQLNACMQFFEQGFRYMTRMMEADQKLVNVCNHLYGVNSAGHANFNADNLATALQQVNANVCQSFAKIDQLFDDLLTKSQYTIPSNTTNKNPEINPVAAWKYAFLIMFGQKIGSDLIEESRLTPATNFTMLGKLCFAFDKFIVGANKHRQKDVTLVDALKQTQNNEILPALFNANIIKIEALKDQPPEEAIKSAIASGVKGTISTKFMDAGIPGDVVDVVLPVQTKLVTPVIAPPASSKSSAPTTISTGSTTIPKPAAPSPLKPTSVTPGGTAAQPSPISKPGLQQQPQPSSAMPSTSTTPPKVSPSTTPPASPRVSAIGIHGTDNTPQTKQDQTAKAPPPRPGKAAPIAPSTKKQ